MKSSQEFRDSQIKAFEKLRPILSKFLVKGKNISDDDMELIEAKIFDRCTEPKNVVNGLREFADMISFLEHIQDDEFHTAKMKRQLTNLQSRIDQLQKENEQFAHVVRANSIDTDDEEESPKINLISLKTDRV